jgi:hypothetical protein
MEGHVASSVADLADWMFVRNTDDAVLELTLMTGIETTTDLFAFFLHLLCCGLVMMHGDRERRSVVVDDLSMPQLSSTVSKMGNAGIIVNFDKVMPSPASQGSSDCFESSTAIDLSHALSRADAPARLEQHRAIVSICGQPYQISFALRRVVLPGT